MKKIIRCIICMCMVFQIAAITPKADVLAASSDIQTLQQGNSNALTDLETDITGDAGSGVTYMNSTEVINSTSDTKYKNSSPQLAIDGDISTYYSSGLYYNKPEPENDYIQIELPTVQYIYTVNLVPKKYGTSFPYDVEIQISTDGITWTTAATKTDMSTSSQDEIKISFGAKKALKYVRVISKKLKPQGQDDTNYYAQYAEIRLLTPSGENVALLSNGAKASASNPLYGDLFDYETFFSDTIDTGVNWVNITNEFAYNNYKNNLSLDVSETEIANFKKLKDNGINILYRFTNAPSLSDITSDKDKAAADYIAAITSRVTMLKDYVDVWGIFGEINVKDNSYAADYAYVIKKVVSAIKEIDADAKFNMATALIDYGWTKAMLDEGIADYVDIIGIHIYKDKWPTLSYPEMAGNYISNGVEITNPTETYADYEAEIVAYKNLIESYSSDMKIMVTEVSEPEGLLANAVGEGDVLAKWLTRQYTTDKLLGIDGTFWFTVDPVSAPRIVTTLVDTDGNRTPAWYALQNYNSVFSGTNKKSLQAIDITGQTDNLKYGVFENETEYIIPYWYAVSFLEEFESGLINVDLSGFYTKDVTAVDLLTGKEQKINIENGIAKNLIVQDYVTVLRVKKEEKTGIVWNEISDPKGLGLGHNGHDTRTSLSLSSEYSSDGNGSAKIEWVGPSTEGSDAQIGVSAKAIPAVAGAAAKSITMDVYLPQTVNGSDNGAIGSTLAGYVKMSDGVYLNGDVIEARTLSAGWNSVTFDAVNGVEMPFFIWKNPNKQGVIYIDDMRINYQYPNEIFDSFENYTDDWKAGGYTLEENTDPSYVKDGKASMKIVCSSTGETYAFVSKLLNLSNVNGKQVPLIEGYTPKTFGFWVYSDGAAAKFKPEGTETWQSVDGQGWTYLAWDIPAATSSWYKWDIDHFNQMVVKVTTPGNLYVDAMSIGYQENSETVLDGLETFYWTAGGCYSASGYGLNTDQTYVKDGTGSGKFVIPANKNYDDSEYVYSNSGLGITIPEVEGKVIKKIGMWVYGTGVSGTYLRPGFRTATDNSYRPFGEIDLNFTGWKYIETNISSETLKFYNIQAKNTTGNDAVFYIDKIVAKYVNAGTNIWSNELKNGDNALDLSRVEAGDVISYDVLVNKTNEMNYGISIIIAGYDENGVLMKVGMTEIAENETGELERSAGFEIESDSEAEMIQSVKGFVWNSTTMEPLIDCASK